MYNQNNNNNNLWQSMTPLVPLGYGTQPLNPLQITSNLLPQNVNQLMPYYNQNQGYGQHFNGSYSYFGSPLIPHSNLSLNSQYLSQSNQSFVSNTSNQSYSLSHLNQLQNLNTNQTPNYNPIINSSKDSDNNKWLNLLNASQKQVLDQLNKEQEAFELQFRNWEKDFENWKQVNRSHPDSSAYQLYVNQWQEWRKRLVERQFQMKELRTRTLQQLYSQIKPQISQTISNAQPPPPPPPRSEVQPPLPPAPPEEKRNVAPPPPPPPPTQPSKSSPIPTLVTTNTYSSQKNSNINRNNSKNTNNFSVNLNEIKDNKSDNIEIIEIDCESKTTEEKRSESKSDTNADPKAVSKAAEALLFIQKQQELLKSLENIKNVKTTDNSSETDIQIIESKPFDIKDIVTKMKAIRPPEIPIEANKILSSLPSLQGIVFHSKPNPQNDSHNQSFKKQNDGKDLNQKSFNNNNNSNMLSSDLIENRHNIPPNKQNFMQTNENLWGNQNPNMSVDSHHYYRMNDKPIPQTNTNRKYSAQTIDYNHRHENRDLNTKFEPSFESQSYLPSNPMTSAFNLKNNLYVETNPNNCFNRQMFADIREPQIDSSKAQEIEEKITYRDMRYFTNPKSRIVPIDDLLKPPTREFRPQNIVLILRGLPGSGKTFIAKLIKEKEMEFCRSAPRILSIDDYFMTEVERQTKSSEKGKTVTSKEYVYEYEKEMESCYRASLLKTYKKTVDDRLFPFIIIDAVNELIADIEDFYSYAIKNDFVVYVIEMVSNDPTVCHKNNIHNRNLEDIKQIYNKWQTLPEFMLRLDIRSLLQNISIKNVEMEVNPQESDETSKRKLETEPEVSNKQLKSLRDSEEDPFNGETRVSRWERMEASESKLDKLDSFKMKSKSTIEEYLQVTDDYDLRLKDKQKRVRWADIEEKKKQEHMRQRGFVMGLDWQQYMDPQHPQRVLTETKYF